MDIDAPVYVKAVPGDLVHTNYGVGIFLTWKYTDDPDSAVIKVLAWFKSEEYFRRNAHCGNLFRRTAGTPDVDWTRLENQIYKYATRNYIRKISEKDLFIFIAKGIVHGNQKIGIHRHNKADLALLEWAKRRESEEDGGGDIERGGTGYIRVYRWGDDPD